MCLHIHIVQVRVKMAFSDVDNHPNPYPIGASCFEVFVSHVRGAAHINVVLVLSRGICCNIAVAVRRHSDNRCTFGGEEER